MRKELLSLAASALVRRRKTSLLTFSVLLLSFSFLIVSLSLVASINRTNQEYRMNTYGQWYGAIASGREGDGAWLKQQAWAGDVGSARYHGEVSPHDNFPPFAVGWADEAYFRVGRIELEAGRLPSADNEVALEAGVLERLGLDESALGQEIVLEIDIPVNSGAYSMLEATQSYILMRETFLLCGIIHDYSDVWNLHPNYEGRKLLSGFLTEAAGEKLVGQAMAEAKRLGENTAEMRPVPQYFFTVEESLRETARAEANEYMITTRGEEAIDRQICVNAYAYPETEEQYDSFYTVLILVITLFAVLCVYVTRLQEQVHSFAVFRSIGITRRQLAEVIAWETLLLSLPAALLGTGLGAALTWAALRSLLFVGSVPVLVVIPLGKLAAGGLVWLAAVLAARLAVFLLAVRAPLTGRFRLEMKKGRALRRCRSGLAALLTALLGLEIIFTAMSSVGLFHQRAWWLGCPVYRVSRHAGAAEGGRWPGVVTPEEAERLAGFPGVASADGFATLTARVSFPGLEEWETMFLVIDETYWEDTFRFGEDGVDREAFHSGEVVILCLPEHIEDSYDLSPEELAKLEDGFPLPPEGCVTLRCSSDENFSWEAQVGDIQYITSGHMNRLVDLWQPYTVVCSHQYLKCMLAAMEPGTRWDAYRAGEAYGYESVFIVTDRNSKYLASENVIREYCKTHNMSCFAYETNVLEEVSRELILVWYSGGCVMLVLLFILISTLALEREQERQKYRILRAIGMSRRQMDRQLFRRTLGRSCLAAVIGWAAYFAYRLFYPPFTWSELGKKWSAWVMSFRVSGFHWYHWALLTAVCVAVPLGLMLLIGRGLREKEDDYGRGLSGE